MKPEYDAFAGFYDLEYGHKQNDLDFYLELAHEIGAPVLEVGVGTGRVALDIAQDELAVVGIDNSLQMLKQAREKLVNMELTQPPLLAQMDMRYLSLQQQFPLCIIPFRAFLHNLTQQDQLDTLTGIHQHLQPGGYVALDLFVPLYHIFANNEWHDHVDEDELDPPDSGVSIEIRVEHEPREQLVTIANTYSQADDSSETATMQYRYVFRYEMEALLRAAGFNVSAVYGDFDKSPYNYQSGIMVFIAQKPH